MANDTKIVNGVAIELTDEEQAERLVAKKTWDDSQADYIANHKYKDDRVAAYPTIGDQLDALWKGGDDQAAMKILVDKVKSDNPK